MPISWRETISYEQFYGKYLWETCYPERFPHKQLTKSVFFGYICFCPGIERRSCFSYYQFVRSRIHDGSVVREVYNSVSAVNEPSRTQTNKSAKSTFKFQYIVST